MLWQGLPQTLQHDRENPGILLSSPPLRFVEINSGIEVLPLPIKDPEQMQNRQSVQRFYLTVIKGEADDDSKPVNLGLAFTDNMHQIKLTKISLGAGQRRVRGKDVATRKPHVLGPSSNTTSMWEDRNKRAAELEHACPVVGGSQAPEAPVTPQCHISTATGSRLHCCRLCYGHGGGGSRVSRQ